MGIVAPDQERALDNFTDARDFGLSGLVQLLSQAPPRQETSPVSLTTSIIMNPQRQTLTIPFVDAVIPSDPAEARCFQDQIEQYLQALSVGSHDIFSIRLALEEALINAIKHGNQLDKSKKVSISYRLVEGRFEVHISDEGVGFDPNDVPDPTAIENLERPCGRGVMLMRYYMDEVSYTGGGNTVSMSRTLRGK
jgi:serine/threonine-protein kinase RsbW